ncbi:MAG TPA: M56 family metallopeptidase [Candidatus Methylomirabilis sp.]|nr:M56 family metallopeptidase [Candidatus Methylomirabilis sp.]
MILPYLLRLVCLSFASFFVLNAACSMFILFFSNSAIHHAERKTAQLTARLLFALRVLPFVLATFFVFGLCVPSYLWLEPSATTERVGSLCVAFGALGAATWLFSVARSARILARSHLLHRDLVSSAREVQLREASSSVLVVEADAPILAMSGLLHPRPLISSGVLNSLSAYELEAALSHEEAHRLSHDNARRLLFVLVPDPFPFVRAFRVLEENWSKLAEWAADDYAARGSSLRAISLASALVRVARMGAAPRLPELSTSLLACDRDLSARVQRLLDPIPATSSVSSQSHFLFRRSGYLFTGGLVFLLLAPAMLSSVHQLLERFLR